jgi:hypothetical protein
MVATTSLSDKLLNANAGRKRAATISGTEVKVLQMFRETGLSYDSEDEVRSPFPFAECSPSR